MERPQDEPPGAVSFWLLRQRYSPPLRERICFWLRVGSTWSAELTRDIDFMQTLKPRTLPGRGFSLRDRGAVSFFEGDVPDELQRLDFFGATKNQEMLGASMTNSLTFRVEASDEDDLIVTLDGTTHMVKYRKYDNQRGLKLFHVRGDATAPIHDIHFLARASQLANAKAKELGWFA